MLHQLWGNWDNELAEDNFDSMQLSDVVRMWIDEDENDGDGMLKILFADDGLLKLWDSARTCCETRWIHTDDDLDYLSGSRIMNIEVAEGSMDEDENGYVEECEFLRIITNKGTATFSFYNNHNGYYGGISLGGRYVKGDKDQS